MPTVGRRSIWALAAPIALVVIGPGAAALTYTVEPGDAVWTIAHRHDVDVNVLVAVNDLEHPDLIQPGADLVIPDPIADGTRAHVVAAGDTIWSIARRHGVGVGVLARQNGIGADATIIAGQVLMVPASPTSPRATTVAVTRAGISTVAGSPSQPAGTGAPGAAVAGTRPLSLQTDPVRSALDPTFERWATTYGVPVDLLRALTWYESGWDNERRSTAGEIGIGQLLPVTADYMADLVDADLDPAVADDNIQLSARYLRYLIDETGSLADAVAAWHQGLETTRRDGITGTARDYVDDVMALRTRFG